MTTLQRGTLVEDLRKLYESGVSPDSTDGELLDRFQGQGAEAACAFATLVARHGPMVLRVCRSALADPHDADDAFQATFLVLLRKSATIRRRASCASWLHGVAIRAAAEIRKTAARRKVHEQQAATARVSEVVRSESPVDDLRRVIDEEIARLDERDRGPIVLCDLEGRSCEDAARRLGWPVGTVKSRLSRGRERLRARLARRGVDPALVAAVPNPPPAVPSALAGRLAEATSLGRCVSASDAMTTTVLALTRHSPVAKLGFFALVVLAGAGLVAGLSLATGTVGTPQPHAQATVPTPAKVEEGVIHVAVQNRDGTGVPGVEVAVYALDEAPTNYKAGADGRLRIPRPPAGFAQLLSRRPGELAWGHFYKNSALNAPLGTEDQPIVLTFLRLNRSLGGKASDSEGNPVVGARVAVRSLRYGRLATISAGNGPTEAVWGMLLGDTVTDARGRYSLTLPEQSGAGLFLTHPDFVTEILHVDDVATEAAPAILEAGGAIDGTVRNEEGRPVARALLVVEKIGDPIQTRGAYGMGESDAAGKFAIRGLAAGVFNLHTDRVFGRPHATARAIEGVRVRTGEDARADVALIEGRPLRVVVNDAWTNQPVPGAEVGCHGPNQPRSGSSVLRGVTDSLGQITFYVPPGEQYVYVSEPAMSRTSRANVNVPEEGEAEPVRLLKNARVPNQGPAYGVRVVEKAKAEPPQKAVAGLGKAVKKNATTETVTVAKPDAPKPDPRPVDGKTVTGIVTDPQGRPVPGIWVILTAPGGGPHFGYAATDRDGLFVLRDAPRRPMSLDFRWADEPGTPVALDADRTTVDHTFQRRRDAHDVAEPRERRNDEAVPETLQGRLTFADVDGRGNEFLGDGPGGTGNDLDRLPRGVREFGATFFRVGEKLVHLRGRFVPDLPASIGGIRVGTKANVLHFLHAGQYGNTPPKAVAEYTVRYADGSTATIPVVEGKESTNWMRFRQGGPDELPNARLGWLGTNDSTDLNPGSRIRLFVLSWTNPHPEREIASIDFASMGTDFDPFVVAITAERTGAGAP